MSPKNIIFAPKQKALRNALEAMKVEAMPIRDEAKDYVSNKNFLNILGFCLRKSDIG